MISRISPTYLDSLGASNEGKVGILRDGSANSVVKADRGLHCRLADNEGTVHANEGLMQLILYTKLAKVVSHANGIGQRRQIVGRVIMAAIFDNSLTNISPTFLISQHSHLCGM